MNKSIVAAVFISAIIAFTAGWTLANMSNVPQSFIDEEITEVIDNKEINTSGDEEVLEYKTLPVIDSRTELLSTSIKLEQLIERNETLEKELEEQIFTATQRYERLASQFNIAQGMLNKEGKKLETMSEEEAIKLLPQPFAGLVSKMSGSIIGKFKQLQTQEKDYEWADLIEQQITDHYISHEYSYAISLQSVICKQNICEIRGFQKEDKLHNLIMNELSRKPWWKFNSSHSSSGDEGDYGKYFYTIVSKSP